MGTGAYRDTGPLLARHPPFIFNVSKGLMMSSTFNKIADIIAETCDIPRDTITPDSHAIDDLGIDSLDFLDIAFAIDKHSASSCRWKSGLRRSTTAKPRPNSISS